MSEVPCLTSEDPCLMSEVPRLMSKVPRLMSEVSCLMSEVLGSEDGATGWGVADSGYVTAGSLCVQEWEDPSVFFRSLSDKGGTLSLIVEGRETRRWSPFLVQALRGGSVGCLWELPGAARG